MERGWELPEHGHIKINVHAITYNQPLGNGNTSGIGVVLRDHTGDILLMVSGTIRNLSERANELWAMLVGLRCAFYGEDQKIILETESEEAVREWDDWRWFIEPNHRQVIQQLVRRREDKNLKLDVKVIQETQNALARFLAEDGAHNRNRLVVFRRAFGRVREIWHLDMGLGPVHADFDLLEEEDYLQLQQNEIDHDNEGFGEWLVHDADSGNVNNVD